MSNQKVPDILKQKFIEIEGSSKILLKDIHNGGEKSCSLFENGKFLLWRGVETGLFFVTGSVSPGSVYIFDYKNGTEDPKLVINYKFGRTAVVVDALYFMSNTDQPGILVAITDRSLEVHQDYIAYISLTTKSLLKSFYLPHPITTLCTILDGTAEKSDFSRLASSFHHDWSHILLVGCRYGYVSLLNLDLDANSEDRHSVDFLQNVTESPIKSKSKSNEIAIQPVRPRKNVHLSKIFYEDQMFVFRADDGQTRCQPKEKVYVSALHWIEKPGLAVIGFNFGGILVISLRTSKVFSMFFMDGLVQHFAVQEPEEDPRPILYLWIAYNSFTIGSTLLMCTINFPKDEESAKITGQEYTYLEPHFTPCMKWSPDNSTKLVTMRTILKQKRKRNMTNNQSLNQELHNFSNENVSMSTTIRDDSDNSLLFISWLERNRRGGNLIHGALFDLNAFYAKRLIPRIQADSTIARQFPFIARFSSVSTKEQYALLDIVPSDIGQFATPAFLNETIDQLYYPSTYHLTFSCLASSRVFQAKVRPLQAQLIADLAQNIANYFESPHEPARWIHAIGLANSAPSNNINEERACLLRVIVHSFFPGLLSLIDSATGNTEWLHFIQKWIWKEVEITKAKFDDLCSPLFAIPPHEPAPSAKGFIQHARVFFKRASIIFEALDEKTASLAENEKSRSLIIQGRVARQLRLYSTGIAFALVYDLLPVNKMNSQLYEVTIEKFAKRSEKARRAKKTLGIHTLIDEIIKTNPDEEIWQGKTAAEWYPPRDFKSFLPILLMVNITESAKLNLLGYYCLDLESAATIFNAETGVKDGSTPPSSSVRSRTNSEIDQPIRCKQFFSLLLSFFLQEDFSLDEMNRIRALWAEDKRIAEMKLINDALNNNNRDLQPNNTQTNDTLKWMPLGTAVEIKKCQEECLKLDWGIYKFNEILLERRRYNYLLELPPLKGDEPKFVQICHAQCLDVRRHFPNLFQSAHPEPLPKFILERFKNKARHANDQFMISLPFQQQQQPILSLSAKHGQPIASENETIVTNLLSKRPFKENDDEMEQYEELSLTIATPRKKQRLVLFDSVYPTGHSAMTTPPSDSTPLNNENSTSIERSPIRCPILQKDSMRPKDWERISKVTETPLSLRKSINHSRLPVKHHRYPLRDRARTSLFPQAEQKTPPSAQKPSVSKPSKPSSILKSEGKKSRLPPHMQSDKPKIRFAESLTTTEQIPSRHEKADDDRHNSSFTNFTVLSPPESSTSGASTLQPEAAADPKTD